jgi:hypothetical protein
VNAASGSVRIADGDGRWRDCLLRGRSVTTAAVRGGTAFPYTRRGSRDETTSAALLAQLDRVRQVPTCAMHNLRRVPAASMTTESGGET